MLTADRDRLALHLFAQALDLDPGDQTAWVRRATGDDAALGDRVLALIRADCAVTDIGTDGPPAILPPPVVGVYRLDQMIGAGGMGAVYRASRSDGLFEQVVAIKFMAARQGALDLGPLIDAERRSLARMDHDNIARILDGGQTEQGLHYLVMEHVEGETIGTGLDPGAAVALIRQVSAALAHAHQSGIVHCDVKPGNILVTPEGRAKLIDFGIARLQDSGLAGTGAAGGLDAMTRAYASPARMAQVPATLADDVYALAVTLFEVLAGHLPWADPGRADSDAPPLFATIPGRNGMDLSAILAKALSPDPASRYRRIEAFDEDLSRWQGGFPVSAIAPRAGYLVLRLAQRRPWPVALGLGALVALVAALAVMLTLYLAAETARTSATARFDDLRSLARFMIFDLNSQLEQVPGATPARAALSEQAQSYLDGLAASALDDAGLQREVATGLLRLAEVQGVPSRPNLGQPERALANLDRALALFDSLIATASQDPVLRADRGQALYFLAITRGVHDQDPEGQLALAQRAETDVLAAMAGADGPRRADLDVLLLGVRLTWADALALQGDAAGALALRQSEEARIIALTAAERVGLNWDYEAGRVAALVGDGHYAMGGLAQADDAYARAAARFGTGLADEPLNRKLLSGLHYARYARSATRADLGDMAGGLAQAEASAVVAQRLLDWDPADRLALQLHEASLGQIALMLRNTGQTDAAIAIIEAQVQRYRARAAASPDDAAALRQVAVPLRHLAEMRLMAEGQGAGCAAYDNALTAWAAVDARFGLTPVDRDNDVAQIAAAMAENGC